MAIQLLKIKVPLEAKPQGSKTAYKTAQGRVVLVEASKGLKNARTQASAWIRAEANRQGWQKVTKETPVGIMIIFRMARPKTVTREHHTVKPDTDKMVRFTLDAVTDAGNIWTDDQQVTLIHAVKQYVQPKEQPSINLQIWEKSNEFQIQNTR